jgi:hypothetical protein
MAYVVARPQGRFEIRESVHTDKGPRARSLASFSELTDEVVAKAHRRATRPFDAEAVRASAARARRGAHGGTTATTNAATTNATDTANAATSTPRHRRPDMRKFVESTRRMARALETQSPRAGSRRDPGDALIDLLGFVAQVSSSAPRRVREPLRYPPLARLRAARKPAAASMRRQ